MKPCSGRRPQRANAVGVGCLPGECNPVDEQVRRCQEPAQVVALDDDCRAHGGEDALVELQSEPAELMGRAVWVHIGQVVQA